MSKFHTSTSSTQLPQLTLSSTATLSPRATLQGTHPITIGDGAIIHPFAILNAAHAPIVIGAGTIVWERAEIGGSGNPVQSPAVSTNQDAPKADMAQQTTSIGSNVSVHPLSRVDTGAKIGDGAEVAVAAHVGAGAVVGARCRVGEGEIVAPGARIGVGEVLYGGGKRRVRHIGAGVVIGVREEERRALRELVKGGGGVGAGTTNR
ncbi:hypothetical protein MRB53_037309 [Persea americana]|nr:hypothetical protein MRB53_037309 [Persea americana]